MNIEQMDAVPNREIVFGSEKEKQEWLAYSLFVLCRRGDEHEAKARRLMFNPFRYFQWRREMRAWEALTERMQAIIDAANEYEQKGAA